MKKTVARGGTVFVVICSVICLVCLPVWVQWSTAKRSTLSVQGKTYEILEISYNRILWHAHFIYHPLLDLHATAFGYQDTGFAGAAQDSLQTYARLID